MIWQLTRCYQGPGFRAEDRHLKAGKSGKNQHFDCFLGLFKMLLMKDINSNACYGHFLLVVLYFFTKKMATKGMKNGGSQCKVEL